MKLNFALSTCLKPEDWVAPQCVPLQGLILPFQSSASFPAIPAAGHGVNQSISTPSQQHSSPWIRAHPELLSVNVSALKAHPEHYQLSVVVKSQTMVSPASPSIIQFSLQKTQLNNPLISMECFFSLCQQWLWLSDIVPKGLSPRF